MGRYQIAVKKSELYKASGTILQFPATSSVSKAIKFINYCIKQRSDLKAPETPTHVIEDAIIKISRLNSVPIIVTSRDKALMLSMVHSHQDVFSLDKPPKEGSWVICYDCELPLNYKSYVSIFTK